MCGEPGIHPTTPRCIEALTAERDRLKQQLAHQALDPSVKALDHYAPGYYDY